MTNGQDVDIGSDLHDVLSVFP